MRRLPFEGELQACAVGQNLEILHDLAVFEAEDQGIRHVYIKPRSPQLNGKVERSRRSDQEEFYQLLNYVDDQNLNEKL